MANITSGYNNIAIGENAGYGLAGNEYQNIYIGNWGAGSECSTIRLGNTATQTSCYIAGINGTLSSGGSAVYINAAGKLGTSTSSRRYKEDIKDLGLESDKLMQLRPVSFTYINDHAKHKQYGLIAEEVEAVMPELVIYQNNKPETVAYQHITPLLLHEAQRQNNRMNGQDNRLSLLEEELADLRMQISKLSKA
jgi:hypothetical protein